jgi:hypothetical protein
MISPTLRSDVNEQPKSVSTLTQFGAGVPLPELEAGTDETVASASVSTDKGFNKPWFECWLLACTYEEAAPHEF